jgi:hypothetical protein
MYHKLIFILTLFWGSQSISIAQCMNTSFYPAMSITPTAIWAAIDFCNWAGEYAMVNVVAGDTYYFSTQYSAGTNINYDSQLTLRDNSGNFIDYNDDAPDGFFGGALIIWEANYTGIAQIHLNQFNCAANNICTSIMTKFTTVNSLEERDEKNELFTVSNTAVPGIFQLAISHEVKNSNSILSVYSITGEVVFEESLNLNFQTLNLSNFASGIYIIQIIDEKGRKDCKKIYVGN